jgi:23S rRNA (uracil1939-C5)-methyltransferase
VREELRAAGTRVVELYAGDGNFTRDLVADGASVLAIEEDAGAIARLKQSLPGVEAVAARAELELRRRTARGERWDRLLLDPPRAGAKEAVPEISAASPARIVYVSCDPATLARDLRRLGPGYRLAGLTAFDLFPQTAHVETVAVLERS